MYVVYKLVNQENQIEYIGHTKNPKTRLRNHTCINGKFAGRTDITLEIIKSGFRKKNRAFEYECKIQNELGWESDKEKYSKNMKEVQKTTTEEKSIETVAYKTTGELVGIFPSIIEAGRKLGINNSLIHNVITGKQKSTKGYVFKAQIKN